MTLSIMLFWTRKICIGIIRKHNYTQHDGVQNKNTQHSDAQHVDIQNNNTWYNQTQHGGIQNNNTQDNKHIIVLLSLMTSKKMVLRKMALSMTTLSKMTLSTVSFGTRKICIATHSLTAFNKIYAS
jgi:hypothetical protein